MLGRLNWLECRLWLAVAGITRLLLIPLCHVIMVYHSLAKIFRLSCCHIFYSILLGLLVSLGLASALSLPYTPMHAILPFLCLGIGIDDMFVIMQCLNNIKYVSSEEKILPKV